MLNCINDSEEIKQYDNFQECLDDVGDNYAGQIGIITKR